MVARLTKYYVEVLGARGDPLEPVLTASLNFSQTVGYELTASRSPNHTVLLTHTAAKAVSRSLSSSLIFTQVVESLTELSGPLSLTQAVEVHGTLRQNISHTVTFAMVLAGYRNVALEVVSGGPEFDPNTGTITPKTFSLSDTAAYSSIYSRAMSDSLTFGASVVYPIGPEQTSTLSLSQTVDAEQVKTMSNGLSFSHSVTAIRSTTNPSESSGLKFDHTVNYSIQGINSPCTYSPFSGGTSYTNTTELLPSEPSTTTRNYVELKYPVDTPTTTVTLTGPDLGERHRLNFQRVNSETRGGTLTVYADSVWPKTQTLSLQFIGLSETEGQEVLDFINLSLGKQIEIIDWQTRTWRGIITTPQEPLVRNHQCNLAVNFDFEGGILTGIAQVTALVIFEGTVYLALFDRAVADDLIFTQTLSYQGVYGRSDIDDLIFTQVLAYLGEYRRSDIDDLIFTQVMVYAGEFTRPEIDSLIFTHSTVYGGEFTRPETDALIFGQDPDNSVHIRAADTPWCGYNPSYKLYLQSGQFSSTVVTSQNVTGTDAPLGVSWDGDNTPWTGNVDDKLYLTSGQFTSTLKDSEDVSSIESEVSGISSSAAGDTPWCGQVGDKLYLTSGQFTSTLKTSYYAGVVDLAPLGLCFDDKNTPWAGSSNSNLLLQSGQFTSTVKTSQSVSSYSVFLSDISWDGVNTPWSATDNTSIYKLYLQSGQFTSTLKTSEDISSINLRPHGVETNNIKNRLADRFESSGSLELDGEVTETLTQPLDTLWAAGIDDSLMLQSGQFSSTLKTSWATTTVDTTCTGISWTGVDTPWSGIEAGKLYLTSGQFTSTIKDSEDISSVDANINGISWDGTDTPWCGGEAGKLYLQSGVFSSTLKTSEDVSGVDTEPEDISWDGTNTPWCGTEAGKLYLQSGQFTSTVKTSVDVTGVDTEPRGLSYDYDTPDSPWCGTAADKLYLQSGQFTSTVKTSEDVSALDGYPNGVETAKPRF